MATYTDVGNGIRCTGTGCNFEGAYQADVAGGWGHIVKIGTRLYYSNGVFYIGDGATLTEFIDTQKCFELASGKQLNTYNNATFKLGTLSAIQSTYNPCVIMVNGADINFAGGSTVRMYGTNFIDLATKQDVLYPNADCEFYGCSFSGFDIIRVQAGYNPLFKRCSIGNGDFGIRPDNAAQLDDVKLSGNNYGIRYNTGQSLTFENSDVRANGVDISNLVGYTVNLKNTTFGSRQNLNTNGIVKGSLSFNMKVVDKAGDGIENVTVIFKDTDGTTQANELTDINGNIAEIELPLVTYTGTSETQKSFNPYTITILKSGYVTKEYKKNIANYDGEVETQYLSEIDDQNNPTFDDSTLAAAQSGSQIDLTIPTGTSNSGVAGVMYAIYMAEGNDPAVGTPGNLFSGDFLQITNDSPLSICNDASGEILGSGDYRFKALCIDYVGNVTGGTTVAQVDYIKPLSVTPPQVVGGGVDTLTPAAVTGGYIS